VLDFLKLDKFRFKDDESFQHLNNILDLREDWISEKRREKKENRELKVEIKKDLSLQYKSQEFSVYLDDACVDEEFISLENNLDYDFTNGLTSEEQRGKCERGKKESESKEGKKNTKKNNEKVGKQSKDEEEKRE